MPDLKIKLALLITSILILSLSISAQKPEVPEFADVDKKALQLPDSSSRNTKDISDYINVGFKTDTDKVRAIIIWTAYPLRPS